MTISLVLVRAGGEQREVPIKKARVVIGRKPGCDVRVGVPAVSREHCELNVGGGKLTMRDMGSSNGTYVNGQRVQNAILGAGDVLAVGPAVFVVRVAGKPAEIDTASTMSRAAPKAAPTAAAAGPAASARRPAAPAGSGKPKPAPAAKDDDLLTALGGDSNDDSSVVDFDFDIDDDDEKKQPKL